MRKASPRMRHRNLPLLLLQAREHVMSQFRPVLKQHGITEQQWRIVRLLLDTGPLEPKDIGRRCRVSSPSLAGVLSRMENLRFISRRRLPNDQRRVLVSLAPSSMALAHRMAAKIEAIYAQVETILGDRFCRELYRSLDVVIEKLETSVRATSQKGYDAAHD